MTERQATLIAAGLGAVVLILILAVCHPFSWGTEEERAEVVTPSAVESATGGAVSGSGIASEEDPFSGIVGDGTIYDPDGTTVATRILPPKDYHRTSSAEGSLATFLRDYEVKKSGAKVKYYTGSEKVSQTAAVLKLPVDKRNLQQAAGTILRVYGEYMWQQQLYDQISFVFPNSFQADYKQWQSGKRIQSDASGTRWVEQSRAEQTRNASQAAVSTSAVEADTKDSHKTFTEYMESVLLYTGMNTLAKETKKIKKSEIHIGDLYLQSGNTSHVVMIVDECVNEDGKKAYLLAQGGTPAQQFHIILNPAHKEDPWYYESELKYPVRTADFTFEKGTLCHPVYLDAVE